MEKSMTNTHKQRKLVGKEEGLDREGQVEYEELSTRLASCEDLESLESLTEVSFGPGGCVGHSAMNLVYGKTIDQINFKHVIYQGGRDL